MRILLVEDEPELAKVIVRSMESNDFEVDSADTLKLAWEYMQGIDYPVIILDRLLPDGDGLTLIDKSQTLTRIPRFLVLSALGDIDDKVKGLESGANDYIAKPYDPKELLARVRAMLRVPRAENEGSIEVGALIYDRANRNFTVHGEELELRRMEYGILELLVLRPGHIVRRTYIEDQLYGYDEAPSSNTMESHVSRLRHRLDELDAGVQIQTARGLGYLIRRKDEP